MVDDIRQQLVKSLRGCATDGRVGIERCVRECVVRLDGLTVWCVYDGWW